MGFQVQQSSRHSDPLVEELRVKKPQQQIRFPGRRWCSNGLSRCILPITILGPFRASSQERHCCPTPYRHSRLHLPGLNPRYGHTASA